MEYMCAYKTCPHHADPCIFSEMDLEKGLSHSTICPVGEEERFITINRNKMFFCLIVGTRTYDDYETFSKIIDKVLSSKRDKKVVIVSGGAHGADAMAERYAKERGYHLVVFEAEWERLGKKAGPARNEQMHKFISQFPDRGIIAFWDGKSTGTASNFPLSRKYANQIRIFDYKERKFIRN